MVLWGNYTVNLPSWFPTAEGCQVVFPAKHTKHAKKVCITPVACGRKGPHVRPSSRRLESHAFRRRHSARPCASLRSAQVPGSPGGPVHAGEAAGRVADGGVPRARDGQKNLLSRRWRGTRSCEAWWLHRPNQVPFVSFVCFAGNGFRQVNCIIPQKRVFVRDASPIPVKEGAVQPVVIVIKKVMVTVA